MSSAFSFGFGDNGDESDSSMHEAHKENLQPDVSDLDTQQSGLQVAKVLAHTDLVSKSHKPIHLKQDSTVQLPQRDFQDIQAQLMAEDSAMNANEPLAPGLSDDDLKPNIYEGGFKTWECAVDLASYVLTQSLVMEGYVSGLNLIELGAGTALPTLSLFWQWLLQSDMRTSRLHIILTDYNQSVLELATIPNLFLTWYSVAYPQNPSQQVEVTTALRARYLDDLKARNISISIISGGWSPEFSALLSSVIAPLGQANTLILASETIYAPASLHAFTACILDILRNTDGLHQVKALVASKNIYFGVGGGVNEFLALLRRSEGHGE
ncbi:uncharacterized protein KY384_004148 [Bacidia gigantensis]|uniref:uncharacterized protein n=1 Tax=Bacidia gigantensis TaxID=2732470 RepID=UPI001D051428|nr:uncharacterized protein KY384_004148 [Bacidia gigantensis]KAG8530791.1 hypothetical protein KY384_004148 [Bacidia gigantensis]